jgi:hypothetical protein
MRHKHQINIIAEQGKKIPVSTCLGVKSQFYNLGYERRIYGPIKTKHQLKKRKDK